MEGPSLRRGFTLLELVIVMALMALAVGLVAPNVLRWMRVAEERAWRSELSTSLVTFPVRAYEQGKSLEVTEEALRASLPSLPGDIDLRLSAPLRYSANGIASPGELRVRRRGQADEIWRIRALTGEPVRAVRP